jgi:hypothetical protein
VLTIDLPSGEKEEYLITLPRLRIDGLWYGSPYIELAETSYIQGSTGWLSTVRVHPPLIDMIILTLHPPTFRSNTKARATSPGNPTLSKRLSNLPPPLTKPK